ncbi:MAG: DHH family phosphoesterase [Patescibacteria group bacterium]
MTLPYVFNVAQKEVDRATHVAVLTDYRADGDTFGSSLAFAEHLRSLGKRVTHVAGTHIPSTLKFLPGIDGVTEDAAALHDHTIDLAMIFDSSRQAHAEGLLAHHPKRLPLIVFDHHASAAPFGDVNVVDTTISSTCELVYEYLRHHLVTITRTMAECLMTGLLTDTNLLSNPRTSADVVGKAADLLLAGGSVKNVVRHVVAHAPVHQLQLWGRIFERVTTVPEFDVAIAWVAGRDYQETGTDDEAVADLNDFLASNMHVGTIVFMKEQTDGTIRVSLRSTGRSVLHVAQHFGGGGHHGACAFSLQGDLSRGQASVEEAWDKIKPQFLP